MKALGISQSELHRVLDYRPDSGEFTWKVKNGGRSTGVGEIAGGRTHNGYWRISIGGIRYLAHRLAWVYVFGEIDNTKDIDHINGNPLDNRISNLRLATRSQNLLNKGRQKRNTSGIVGVTWNKKSRTWHAKGCLCGKDYFIGAFNSISDAAAARKEFETRHHGEFGFRLSRGHQP